MRNLLFICLLFHSYSIIAQNWNTVPNNDTVYFKVQATGADSTWDGYLRSIWNDSVSINGLGIETSYFYPSFRLDSNEIIDSTHASTWLGKVKTRNSTGEEIFFNKYGESILIKTNANLNDTWIMTTDSNLIEYHATIASIDTVTIDGVSDSLKTISIQAYFSGNTIASSYNSLPIKLTKNHGFFSLFEFYGFPYYQFSTWLSNKFPFPILPLIHNRLNQSTVNTDIDAIDLLWKYQSGNEWIYYSTYHAMPNVGILHDSIINSNLFAPDSIEVVFYRHTFDHIRIYPPSSFPYDTAYHTYSTITDTFTNSNQVRKIIQLKPEHKEPYINQQNYFAAGSKYAKWYFLKPTCGDKFIFSEKLDRSTPLSGYTKEMKSKIPGFGITDHSLEEFQIDLNWFKSNLIYSKLDSCVQGTKLLFNTLASENIELSNQISIYPNPSNSIININFHNNTAWILGDIFNLQGIKVINQKTDTQKLQIDISDLTDGIYILRITTKDGIITNKILKN